MFACAHEHQGHPSLLSACMLHVARHQQQCRHARSLSRPCVAPISSLKKCRTSTRVFNCPSNDCNVPIDWTNCGAGHCVLVQVEILYPENRKRASLAVVVHTARLALRCRRHILYILCPDVTSTATTKETHGTPFQRTSGRFRRKESQFILLRNLLVSVTVGKGRSPESFHRGTRPPPDPGNL